MNDLISREYMKSLGATCIASRSKDGNMFPIVSIDELPSVQPDVPDTNVGDLISRQDAIDAVKFGITYAKAFNKSTGEVKELFKEGNKALNEAAERLKELPSAQHEIIRCKDCKYYMQTDKVHHRGWCFRWNHHTAIEYYCSEGELRGDLS